MSRCIWCDSPTTNKKELATEALKYANKEHIFPESVGGKRTLPQGLVCEECNNRLGQDVDHYLKYGNFMMMKQYQESSNILGRPAGKKISGRSERKKAEKLRKEKEVHQTSHYSGGTRVEREENEFNVVSLFNLPDGSAGDLTYDYKFSRALHKCAVNALLDKKGYNVLKNHHTRLIDFVCNANNSSFLEWPYAVCYSNLFDQVHFEPFLLQVIEINNTCIAVTLMFPSAIYVVGTQPDSLSCDLLEQAGNRPPKLENWEAQGFDYLNRYRDGIGDTNRQSFGEKLSYRLVRAGIDGTRNPDDAFFLLTKCKVCGQTNPTGMMLPKERILSGNQNQSIGGVKNSWNRWSVEDLKTKGCEIHKWDREALQKYIDTQGISYPEENDVKKLNINKCLCTCISCHNQISYSATDCFI